MGWGKLDDKHHSASKTRATTLHALAAVGLHALGISYSSDQLTNGFLDDGWIGEKLHALDKKGRSAVLIVAEDRRLLDRVEGGWMVHNYLKYNPSRQAVLARRERDAERKAGQVPTESKRNPQGIQTESKQTPSGTPARGRPPARAPGRDGEPSTAPFKEVDGLLAKLRECDRFTVDDISTRVQVENAIGSYPDLDHMAAARESVIWATDPAWRNTNAGGVFLAALRKQSERKPRPGSEKLGPSEWDELARELEEKERNAA